MLSGYKTYLIAGAAIITAIANYLAGDMSLAETIQLVVTAAMGATIRSGINTAAKAVKG